MRVLVDSSALEALCQAAEGKHRHLVAKLRASVRAEPKTEEVTKVSNYNTTSDVTHVERAVAYTPATVSNKPKSDK